MKNLEEFQLPKSGRSYFNRFKNSIKNGIKKRTADVLEDATSFFM